MNLNLECQYMNKIEIYTTPLCIFCSRAKSLLNAKGMDYKEINVSTHPGKRQEMIERANAKSVPQIFANGQHIGDCDRIYALDAIGKLDAALGII